MTRRDALPRPNSSHGAHPSAGSRQPVKLRNVIGVLRGSDPALKDTYLVLTAHYDHLGVRGTGEGDHIYNGANDDASGTSSVIEIAKALAALPRGPGAASSSSRYSARSWAIWVRATIASTRYFRWPRPSPISTWSSWAARTTPRGRACSSST